MNIIRYQKPEPTVWSPFERLSSLRDLLDSAFQLASLSPSSVTGSWVPTLDVFEDEEKVVVQLDAAGMKSEDFDLSLHDGTLTISGERKGPSTEGESFRSERVFGAFRRSISLPSPVKDDAVKATYTDGVLTVTLPKAEEAKPRKITIN
ncbi:MAG: hypothetical protein Fur0032_08840 [Terrimicrobiaceae bacterium]